MLLVMQVRRLLNSLRQRSIAMPGKAIASLLRPNRLPRLHRQRKHSLQLRQLSHRHQLRQRLSRASRPLLPSDKISMSGKEFI